MGEETKHCEQSQINLVITGNDRPGIVQELSSVIRHKGASIIHFTSKQQSAPRKFTDNDFKALRFRFNTIKSKDKRKALVEKVLFKRRLKPGDKYYLEVKSLLDSL